MKRRASYRELAAVPDHLVGELIDGSLYTSPRPAPRHALVATELIGALHGPFHRRGGSPGGWLLLIEPELHFGDDVLVPDLAGWRRERLPEVPSTSAIELVPDWVCEVLSPSTTRVDLTLKLPAYARQGVRHLWLIDPQARTLVAHRRIDGPEPRWDVIARHSGSDRARVEPFDAITLDLSEWWPVAEPPIP